MSLKPVLESAQVNHQTNLTNATRVTGPKQNPTPETTKDNQKSRAARVALHDGEGISSTDLLLLL